MKKTTLLSLALACGLSAFAAQPLQNPQPAVDAIGQGDKVMMTKSRLDLIQLPGVKKAAPAKVATRVADVVGNYKISYDLNFEGAEPYSGEMTVTSGSEKNTVVFNFPFESGAELIWNLIGTLNPEDGTITFSSDQPSGYTGATCLFRHWNGSAWEVVTEVTATYNGETVLFDPYDAFGLQAANGAFYTLFYWIEMSKYNPNEGWTSLGDATFVDGWVIPAFGYNQDDYAYQVELQQNNENPNIYRLVDPYHGNFPFPNANQSTKLGYIQFDATDPDHVVFDTNVASGFANSSAEITTMYCYNGLGYYVAYTGYDAATVVETLGDNIPYATFKDYVLTVPTGDAYFGDQNDKLGGYSWNSGDMHASLDCTKIFEPTGVAPKPAVTELVDGGYYYVYDAHSDRYSFYRDMNAEELVRISGNHINVNQAYGQLPEANYIWTAKINENGQWQLQNVATGHYFGNTNNASETPGNFDLTVYPGQSASNVFSVKNTETSNCIDANLVNTTTTELSYWSAPGHPVMFFTAVAEGDAWNFAADASYTITCNFIYNAKVISTQTFTGTTGAEYSFTAPQFYTSEPVSGVISQYNLTYNVECTLNLPFVISESVENAVYQTVSMHSNEPHMLYYDEAANAIYGQKGNQNVTTAYEDNQLFAYIGSFEEGVKLYSKAAGKAIKMVTPGDNNSANELVDLEEATVYQVKKSDVAGDRYFTLQEAGQPYLNIRTGQQPVQIKYWTAADAGSTMWCFGVGQPVINKYTTDLNNAKAINSPALAETIAQAEEIINGIDPWTEVPEETVAQLDEIFAHVNSVVAAEGLRKYFEASYSGTELADVFIEIVGNASEEDFDEAYALGLEQAISLMQSDMEVGFVMKNKRNGQYLGYVSEADPNDDELFHTQYQGGAKGITSYWVAEFTDNGDEVAPADRKFYLKNVFSNTYVGLAPDGKPSVALPCEESTDDAALLQFVAGDNGFEFIITNSGIENNYLNASQYQNAELVTWNVVNDGGAFWLAEQLPTFNEETQPVRVGFVGETTFGEYGQEMYSSIEAIEIKVPAGATVSGVGEINAYVATEEGNVTIFSANVADVLAEAEPAEGNIAETIWNAEGEQVVVTTPADVYHIVLNPARTEAGEYHVGLSAAAFQIESEEAETVFSPSAANYAIIEGTAEPFTIIVTPEAGTVEALVNITLDSYTGMAPSFSYTGEANVTLKKGTDTVLLDLNADGIAQYDTFSFDDLSQPYYTIPVNQTEVGTYSFVIPEGFFENDDMAPNAEVLITWTIEEQDGINSITNVTVNGQTIYDLQGRKVSKAGKGLYIINGEKTIVK